MLRLTTKIEEGIRSYLTANHQGSGDGLEGVTLLIGTRAGVISEREHLVITALEKGGDLTYAGIYEVEVQLLLVTYGIAQDGEIAEEEEAPAERHTNRAHALREIFSRGEMETICDGLNALGTGFGVSCYEVAGVNDGKNAQIFSSDVVLSFTAHLADDASAGAYVVDANGDRVVDELGNPVVG